MLWCFPSMFFIKNEGFSQIFPRKISLKLILKYLLDVIYYNEGYIEISPWRILLKWKVLWNSPSMTMIEIDGTFKYLLKVFNSLSNYLFYLSDSESEGVGSSGSNYGEHHQHSVLTINNFSRRKYTKYRDECLAGEN